MLASPIESLMFSLGASAITDIMLLLLVGLFAASAHLKRQNKAHGFTHYTPPPFTACISR